MKSSKRSGLEMSDELLRTMAVVMSPRRVPYAGSKRLEEYLLEGRDDFHNLLLQAIHEGALPKRVSLVHSVVKNLSSAHSSNTLDMSLVPVITNPKGGVTEQAAKEYCAERLAALALISHAVAKKGAVSAHQWLRKLSCEQNSLTDGGHILIYSTSDLGSSNAMPAELPLAISTAQLCVAPNTPVLNDLTKVSLDYLIKHNGKVIGGQYFYDADLAGLLDSGGIVAALPENLEPPTIVEALPNVAAAYLHEHSEYLAHVAPLAKLGQIVISAPKVLTYRDDTDNLDHNVYDAGLTLLLDGPEPPSPTELLQINIVSRMLAQYAASVFGVARQVALSDRNTSLKIISNTLKHEVSNANEKVRSRLAKVEKKIGAKTFHEIESLLSIGEDSTRACIAQVHGKPTMNFTLKLEAQLDRWKNLGGCDLQVLKLPDRHIYLAPPAILLALNEMLRNAWKHAIRHSGKAVIVHCEVQLIAKIICLKVGNEAAVHSFENVASGFRNHNLKHMRSLRELCSLVPNAKILPPTFEDNWLNIELQFPLITH